MANKEYSSLKLHYISREKKFEVEGDFPGRGEQRGLVEKFLEDSGERKDNISGLMRRARYFVELRWYHGRDERIEARGDTGSYALRNKILGEFLKWIDVPEDS